ncbi:hypothetical protein D9758_010988 [Tetrapyrgos nigripes]|uniref:Uncharacterized protein n=1 Tax=Tetrapyrgos nigripes TaxID=182062 RepID=A0A8H5GHW0_9AGAR|nr:hypothetical protein D9758_010988 [Tetrapyrgos nigripes]
MGEWHRSKRRRLNCFVDIEAEQSGSEDLTDDDGEEETGDGEWDGLYHAYGGRAGGDDDDFINDDSSSSDSDESLDDAGTGRTGNSNTHLAHILTDRSRHLGSPNAAPARNGDDNDDVSSSDSDSSWGSSSHTDSESSQEEPDTLHDIVKMTLAEFEPLWRFRCTAGKERIVAAKLQSYSSHLDHSVHHLTLSFVSYHGLPGWVYVAGQHRSPELCRWIAGLSAYVTHSAHTDLNGSLISESINHHPASFSLTGGISFPSSASPGSSRRPVRDPKLFRRWVRVVGGKHNGEIGYALGMGHVASSVKRVKVLLVPRISLSRLTSSPSASCSSSSPPSSLSPRTVDASNSGAGGSSRKRRRRSLAASFLATAELPPHRLFNPAEIRSAYGQDSMIPVKRCEHGYRFQGDRYQNGLLVERLRAEQLQVIGDDLKEVRPNDNIAAYASTSMPAPALGSNSLTNPATTLNTIPFHLYQLFRRSGHHEIPDEMKYFPRIREWVFDEGDRVAVICRGRVESTSTVSVGDVLRSLANGQVEVDFGVGPGGSSRYIETGTTSQHVKATVYAGHQAIPWWKLAKVFEVGDYVKVVGGVNEGSSGWVVSSNNGRSSGVSSSPSSALSGRGRSRAVGSDIGMGMSQVEVIEKTAPGAVVSPVGDSDGLKSFFVHPNLLKSVPIPAEFSLILNNTSPSTSTFSFSGSGLRSGSVFRPDIFSSYNGATVLIVDPRRPEYGKQATIIDIYRECSVATKRLWVKVAVEITDHGALMRNGLVGMPSQRVELDYFGVVDLRTRKLLHEVYPATGQLHPLRGVTVPWIGVNVTIIQAHSDKGKHAVVRDVVPIAVLGPPPPTTSSHKEGKVDVVEYPSGLRLTVELSGYTAGRTNSRLNLDYYRVATEDKATRGMLKWLHEVYKLTPEQIRAGFRPRSVLEARKYNSRIPEGDIPLPPLVLSYSISELARMMGRTDSTTHTCTDHGPTAGTVSSFPSTPSTASSRSTVSPSSSRSSSTGVSSAASSPSSLSLMSSSSALFPPSSASGLPPFPSVPLPACSRCSSPSIAGAPSSKPSCPYSNAASGDPQSPQCPFSSPNEGNSAIPSATSSGRALSSVASFGASSRASSVSSDSSSISLGSTEPDISGHWILDPRLRGKKIAATAHGGGYINKDVTVIPTTSDDGEAHIVREFYNKRYSIQSRWLYPQHPNGARYNGLMVIIGGEHVGKYVRRYNHTRFNSVYVEVVEHVEGRRDIPTGERLVLEVHDLCMAFETMKDRHLNHEVLKARRDPFYRTHRKG